MVILVQAMFEGNTQNPKIMKILCEEWEKTGNIVIRFFPCSSKDEVKRLNHESDVFAFYYPQNMAYKKFLTELEGLHHSLIAMGLCALRHPVNTIEFVLRRIPLVSRLCDESYIIKKQTERAIKNYKVDVVIAGSNPFYLPLGLAKARVNCKKMWYQMDPHAANGMMSNKRVQSEHEKELYVYEHMDRVFVQPNSYEEIIRSLNNANGKKVMMTRFPLVNPDVNIEPTKSYFEKDTINCVYAGALMLPIRRPDYLFKLFSLFKNKSICLYVWCGNLTDALEAEMRAMMPSNVRYCGALPQNEMQRVLAGADFLVSLGNTVINQLPSKLLDYISLRKPILNIYKVNACPTLDILENYPLSCSVSEIDDAEMASEKLEEFIMSNIGKEADIDIIKTHYHEYLPAVVADYVLNS